MCESHSSSSSLSFEEEDEDEDEKYVKLNSTRIVSGPYRLVPASSSSKSTNSFICVKNQRSIFVS
jgi:hypothetical protein